MKILTPAILSLPLLLSATGSFANTISVSCNGTTIMAGKTTVSELKAACGEPYKSNDNGMELKFKDQDGYKLEADINKAGVVSDIEVNFDKRMLKSKPST
ncbi:MAG: hypothetical protein ACO2ZM_03040 [Francisellaceae bacterium]